MKREILFILILAVSSNFASLKTEKKFFGKELFPLSESTRYVYETNFGDATIMATGNNGIVETKGEGDNFKYFQKLLMNNEGLFVNQTYQRVKLFLFFKKENTVTYNKPLLRYSFPLYVGKTWDDEAIEYNGDDSSMVTVKGKVIAQEDVKTPAGIFNALKIQTEVISTSGSKNTVTEWMAENRGLVKAKIEIQGGGIMGLARDILGYGTINFELKEIIKK